MSKFEDIVDGTAPDIETVRRGLVYTCRCGWIDLGHARADNAAQLWRSISTETGEGIVGGRWYRVNFGESMGKWGLTASESRSFAVSRGLSVQQKESVALGIFFIVSNRFEDMQSSLPWSLATDSGYSVEDLVSDLVGFYRAVRPGIPYVTKCEPVSKLAAENVWKRYGAVGTMKNRQFNPVVFPCAECGNSPEGQKSAMLPSFLSTIQPAPTGELYRPWDPNLVFEVPAPPLPQLNLTLSYWVVQGGDSLSKIAQKEYGDMFLWPLIFDSNRQVIGSNPNIILPGQRLLIPDHTRLSPNQLAETERRGKTEWRR